MIANYKSDTKNYNTKHRPNTSPHAQRQEQQTMNQQLQNHCLKHVRIQSGGQGVRTPPPLKNHKSIGFLSYAGPDPLKNHKAAKPAFSVGPSSTRKRNAI